MYDESPSAKVPDVELAPLRALTDGLLLPALLASPAFWPAMDTARIGYSTRHQPLGTLGDEFLDEAARFARGRQTQRSVRSCNADWEVVWPQLLPGLQAAVVMWLQMTGQPAAAPELEVLFHLLGLDVGTHRRVQLLRSACDAGLLVEPRLKVWRPATEADVLVQQRCPWASLFIGLNQVVPAAHQRFNQVAGSVLSRLFLKQTPSQLRSVHERLMSRVASACRAASVSWKEVGRGSRQHHVVLATFHTISQQDPEPGLGPGSAAGQRLLLLGPAAEAMRRLGPWSVACRLVRRRFVERIQEETSLSGVELYEFIARRYQVRSANSVRAFLLGPPLPTGGEPPDFNRGLVHQVAFEARCALAQVWPEGLSERHLRERVSRQQRLPTFDIGIWQAALGQLQEEDVIRRTLSPSGAAFVLRETQGGVSRATLEQLEAGAKLVLARVPHITDAIAAGEPTARCDARIWLVPRAALPALRTELNAALVEVVQEAGAHGSMLTESEEQQRGMILAEVLMAARVLPLLPP